MDDLNALVAPYLGIAIVALAVACVVLLLARRSCWRGGRRSSTGGSRRSPADPRGAAWSRSSTPISTRCTPSPGSSTSSAARTAVVEAAQRRALQRIGLVRFNPFEDTGGNQSFALALLDAQGERHRRQQPPLAHGHARLRRRRSRPARRRRRSRTRRGRRSAWRSPPERAGRRPDRMRAVTRKLARTRGIVASWPPDHRPPSRPTRTPTRSTTSCA